MESFYSTEQQQLQEQFETHQLAERLQQLIVESQISEQHQPFIESRDFFFLTTIDHRGYPTCSYKGGHPGFVKVLDPQTLAFPSYDGNGMFLSLGNIKGNAKFGLLFIDFENPHRVRVHGDASMMENDPLISEFPGAELVVRIKVSEIFINCPRYIHPMQQQQPSKYVPQANQTAPGAQWKRLDLVQDVLPARDQETAQLLGGIITIEEYGALVMKGEG